MAVNPVTPSGEARCPLCEGPNACGPAASGDFKQRCWCEDVAFDTALLDTIPEEARGRACICRGCMESFKEGKASKP